MKGKRDDRPSTETGEGKPKRARGGFGVIEWFNPGTNSGDREWLDDHVDELPELVFSLLEAVTEDGRFTTKYDVRSSRWLAILFVSSDADGVEFNAMSVRGATAIDAAFVLAYFHLVKYSDGWTKDAGAGDSRWG